MKGAASPTAGSYELDTRIVCKRISAIGLVRPSSERGRQIVKLLASQEKFTDAADDLVLYAKEYENILLDDDYPGGYDEIFGSCPRLQKIGLYFYEQLVKGQVADPKFEEPIGDLLLNVAKLTKVPFLNYCKELTSKLQTVLSMQHDIQSPGLTKSDEGITAAMEAPFLQIQRFPHFIKAIMRASELNMKASMAMDLQTLRAALTEFEDIASKALKLASVTQKVEDLAVEIMAVDENAPVWFHGNISREQADEMLKAEPHGTYLVRQRVNSTESHFVLSLTIHSQEQQVGYVTHHAITRVPAGQPDEGNFMVRDHNFGAVRSLSDLIDTLRVPVEKWPVMLRYFVPRESADPALVASENKRVDDIRAMCNVDANVEDQESPDSFMPFTTPPVVEAVEKRHVHEATTVVVVANAQQGLGFKFRGPKSEQEINQVGRHTGIYITEMLAENLYGKDQAGAGTKIISINGEDCGSMLEVHVMELIQGLQAQTASQDEQPSEQQDLQGFVTVEVTLVLQYDPEGYAVYDNGVLLAQEDAAVAAKENDSGYKAGQLFMAPFTDEIDGTFGFYKAQIRELNPDGESCKMLFVEYGDKFDIKFLDLQPLPDGETYTEYRLLTVDEWANGGPEYVERLEKERKEQEQREKEEAAAAAAAKAEADAAKAEADAAAAAEYETAFGEWETKKNAEKEDMLNNRDGMVPLTDIKGWAADDVGSRVTVDEVGKGVLRFVGNHHENSKARLGVDLDEPNGKMGGSLKGNKYFSCEDKHGVLTVPKKVKKLAADDTMPVKPGEEVAATVATEDDVYEPVNGKNADPTDGMDDYADMTPNTDKAPGDDMEDYAVMSHDNAAPEPDNTIYGNNVVVVKLEQPLGLSLDNAQTGTVVTKVKEGGNGEKSGKIKAGMQLLSFNGQNCVGKNKKEVVTMVKASGGAEATLELVAAPDRAGFHPVEAIKGWTLDDLGKKVTVEDVGTGTLLFIGKHAEQGKPRLGVALDEANGKNDGTIKGVTYFVCEKGHGTLVQTKKVTKGAESTGGAPAGGAAEEPKKASKKASKESDGNVTVTIAKPLGLSLDGNAEDGVRVSKVKEGGNGEANGKVKVGMVLVSLNGESCVGVAKGDVVSMVKAAPGDITLVLKKKGGAKDSEEKASKKASKKKESKKASKESDGNVTVTIAKPLGLSLDGNAEDGVRVSKVKEGGNGEANGKVKVGMVLVSLNGESCVGVAKGDVVSMVKAAPGDITLVLKKKDGGAKAPKKKESKKKESKYTVASVGQPLGLSLEGDEASGIFISKVKEGGNGEKVGTIKVGMQLMVMNGTSCVGKSKKDVVGLVKAAAGTGDIKLEMDANGGYDKFKAAKDGPAAPSGGDAKSYSMDYDAMGKLAAMKEVRSRGIEYERGAGIEVLRKLLKDSDPGGGGGGGAAKKESAKKEEKKPAASAGSDDRTGMEPLAEFKGWKLSEIGSRVTTEENGAGTVRFIGLTQDTQKPRIGVELDEPNGKNSGTVKGVAYFKCKSKHGVLLAKNKVMKGTSGPFEAKTSVKTSGKTSGKGSSKAATDDQYSSMSRLALIKELRGKGIEYKDHAQDIDKLRELCRGGSGGGSAPAPAKPPKNEIDVPTPLGLSFDGYPDAGYFVTKVKPGGNAEATGKFKVGQRIVSFNKKNLNGMAKKAIVQIVKDATGSVTVKWKKDDTGYQNYLSLKAAKDSGGGATAAPAPAKPAASGGGGGGGGGGGDDYEGMGRLQLIKECRTKGIDYKSAGKDVEALKALLRAA